ncbi:unannotated protein [freshwater metagenome]|uniref:Unannotated protein n=1 Tax=freshwater metagenome TaxID=449393 RepID=A0A6J7QFX6_9ZZZZ
MSVPTEALPLGTALADAALEALALALEVGAGVEPAEQAASATAAVTDAAAADSRVIRM